MWFDGRKPPDFLAAGARELGGRRRDIACHLLCYPPPSTEGPIC